MTPEHEGILEFLRAAERLKTVTRSAYTSEGQRESVAEHTWRLCLMALVLQPDFPEVDVARLLKICIVHDLGEAIGGDIPAPEQDAGAGKAAGERADLLSLLSPLPEGLRSEITALWDEYEAAATPEARLAKALDKLETILQHNQGLNPADFDYRFNLAYGARYTSEPPLVASIRAAMDRETELCAEAATAARPPGPRPGPAAMGSDDPRPAAPPGPATAAARWTPQPRRTAMSGSTIPVRRPPAKALAICGAIAVALVAFAVARALTGSAVLPTLGNEEILGILVGMAAALALWWAIA